jgi:drug/metabolite transporter (DMT)-like permease
MGSEASPGLTVAAIGDNERVTAPVGFGLVLILAGLVMLFVPGIGVVGVIVGVIGVLLIVGGFAAGRRRPATPTR